MSAIKTNRSYFYCVTFFEVSSEKSGESDVNRQVKYVPYDKEADDDVPRNVHLRMWVKNAFRSSVPYNLLACIWVKEYPDTDVQKKNESTFSKQQKQQKQQTTTNNNKQTCCTYGPVDIYRRFRLFKNFFFASCIPRSCVNVRWSDEPFGESGSPDVFPFGDDPFLFGVANLVVLMFSIPPPRPVPIPPMDLIAPALILTMANVFRYPVGSAPFIVEQHRHAFLVFCFSLFSLLPVCIT